MCSSRRPVPTFATRSVVASSQMDPAAAANENQAAVRLYDKLEHTILPLYYGEPTRWQAMMKQSIGNIASYFNTHRMMRRYATEAYLR